MARRCCTGSRLSSNTFKVRKRRCPHQARNPLMAVPNTHQMNTQYTQILGFCLIAALGLSYSADAQGIVVNNPACDIGLTLRDGSCDPALNVVPDPNRIVINVNNAPGTALGADVALQEVQLIIRHTWANDLDISLRSPAGTEIVLTSDNGGGDDNYGDPSLPGCTAPARLSMGSCSRVEDGLPPFTATVYRPEESLYHFNDGFTDPNGFWELIICDDAAGDIGRLEYVSLVFAPISCLPVDALNILSVDTTAVTLSWAPESSCGTTYLEYGLPGFAPGAGDTPGEGTVVELNGCPPFTISGLAADTPYEFYARTSCGGPISVNSCPAEATTGCAPPPISLLESFEGEALCGNLCSSPCSLMGFWQNTPLNDYDWLASTGPTPTAGTGPNSGLGAGQYIYLEASGATCGFGKTAYLESGCFVLDKQGTDTCHFAFSYHMQGDGIGRLRLEVSEDGGFNWAPLWQATGEQSPDWQTAYIGLGDYPDGDTLRLRFVGEEGVNARGDIALDELRFHGSVPLGTPDLVFYTDLDGDGFGDDALPVKSCSSAPPPGFSALGGDCDDSDPAINPGAPETPCNSTDENCNGTADENLLPPPVVTHDTICSGEAALLTASPNFNKFIFWYSTPDGDDFAGFGNSFAPSQALVNNGPAPVIYEFYAEESDLVCTSAERAVARVVVNPTPNTSQATVPSLCPGDSIDLAGIVFSDEHLTGSAYTFHSGLPATPGNQLANTTVSADGAYYYMATSPSGCSESRLLTFDARPGPVLSFSPSDSIVLCQEATANALVQASGGGGGFSYQWSTGSISPEIALAGNPDAGVREAYSITVTDGQGCFSVDSLILQTTVSVDSVRVQTQGVSDCSGQDGQLTLTPLDGAPPYAYSWFSSNGVQGDTSGLAGALTLSNLPQGAYRVTITDSSPEGCERVLRSILIGGPGTAIQVPEITPVSCAGLADGQICIPTTGGSPVFEWSNGAAGPCIDNLTGGQYSVTVTDGACTYLLDSLDVPSPVPLQTVFDAVQPSCANTTDGAITALALGGSPPYAYLWSNNINFPDPFGLEAGMYTVTVTDSRGCQLASDYLLEAPMPLDIQLTRQSSTSCAGDSNGLLQVDGAGGTPPYAYAWGNGASSPLLLNLAPGSYPVTVTDFNGCSQAASFVVASPAPVETDVLEVKHPSCKGEKDGLIIVRGQGGTPPYSYAWSNNLPPDSIQLDLPEGRYEVIITDANNCASDTLSITLTAVSQLGLQATVVPPFCEGLAAGSIALSPTGAAPYTYLWASGDTTAQRTGLSTGTYQVLIEDEEGCQLDTALTITAPQVFSGMANLVQPACFNSMDGVANVTVVNAPGAPSPLPPYQFEWNDGETGPGRVGMTDGVYAVSITDSRGCQLVLDSLSIDSPDRLEAGQEALGEIVCHGEQNGFIEVATRGGTPPYLFNWVGENIQTEDIFGLGAGSYRLVIADQNGCSFDTTFLLSQPSPLNLGLTVDAEDICEGGRVLGIYSTISGGTPPYSLQWSNGETVSGIIDPAPADYQLTVTDANNCMQASRQVKVKEVTPPFELMAFETEDISCNGQANGCATAVVSGGSSLYRYHFSNGHISVSDSSQSTICGLSPGNYQVTVTDLSTGCNASSPLTPLSQPAPLTLVRDSVRQIKCFGSSTGGIFTSAAGGTMPYSYTWFDSENNSFDGDGDLTGLPAGSYTGIIIDENGCTASITAMIAPQYGAIGSTLASTTPAACRGDSTGALDVQISGGLPPYTYAWSNGSTQQDLTGVPAGIYALTVTDAAGCIAPLGSYPIGQPDSALVLTQAVIDSVQCAGSADGFISVAAAGGQPPYTYEWLYESNLLPVASPVLANRPQGAYQLNLIDQNGCLKQFDFNLPEPLPLQVGIQQTSLPPSAVAIVDGGTLPYEVTWSDGTTGDTLVLSETGVYGYTVRDGNGCELMYEELLVQAHEEPGKGTGGLLFPNPASHEVWFQYSLNRPEPLRLQLYDAKGLLAKDLQVLPANRQLKTRVSLDQLPEGVYWFVAYSGREQIYAAPLVITR